MRPHVSSPDHVRVTIETGGHVSQQRRGPTHLQLDILRRQRQAMRRQGSYSDVVDGVRCASPVKLFQYAWNVLIILLGVGLLCTGLYFLYYQENAHMVPTLAYYLATFTGPSLALISFLGLYGLQKQRQCITDGRRNYALGMYILLSLIGALIIILGGVIALTLRRVADTAESDDFTEHRVVAFETALITMLDDYMLDDPDAWRGIQNSMYCCGYTSVSSLKLHAKAEWDQDVLAMVSGINEISGIFCAKKSSDCSSVDGFPCPAKGRDWCRQEVLSSIVANYRFLGVYAIIIGSCQIFSALFATFTLLCDIRMISARSLPVEIPKMELSPFSGSNRPSK